ncbi:SH3 domain-containing protein [Viridibacillus sp. NPDC093762]|uniref:SH3 domain-containing protein n=1 Tax=Viridibacillus sp. NPDC093762 TaxID=3390720 RepID=UPI003D05D656
MKRYRYILAIVILISSVSFINQPKIEAKTSLTTQYVQADVLNIRMEATTNSKKLGQLKKNEKVNVISTSNGWSKIQYKKGTAYVSTTYLNSNKAVQKVTGNLLPKIGKYTYKNYEEDVYYGNSTESYVKVKGGVKAKSKNGLETSYLENSKYFTYLSPTGHTSFRLNYPLTKGNKWRNEQDEVQIQDVNLSVKTAAGSFNEVVKVRIDHNIYDTYSHFYIAPGKGIVMWKLNGKKKFQLAKYTK